MEKMRAVTHSLRDPAYLILSGAIKQPVMGLPNRNMMNYDDDYFVFFFIRVFKNITLVSYIL